LPHVDFETDAVAAHRFDALDHRVSLFFANVEPGDIAPLGGKREGHLFAKPLRKSSDQRSFSLKAHICDIVAPFCRARNGCDTVHGALQHGHAGRYNRRDMTHTPDTLSRFSDMLEYVGPDRMRAMLRTMHEIRAFEQTLEDLYNAGKTFGTLHLSIGQEAVAVGTAMAVRFDQPHDAIDYMFSTHRGHGHAIGWGASIDAMMAEFLGKETGLCKGRGGSMHMADPARGNLGGNGIVGGGLPMSVGVGLSIRIRKTRQVCVVFFGDGASNEGAFHESLNMAALWKLPVVYVCENNQYALSTPNHKTFTTATLSERAAAYGMPGLTVDGNELGLVFLALREAIERARTGGGPTLVEAKTYRVKGHSRSDRQSYRSRDEVKAWQTDERDPIARYATLLIDHSLLTAAEADAYADEAVARVGRSIDFADASPAPALTTIQDGLYA
jgi:pyruvate dehydrogenase E1 component alpha subunit